MRPTLLLVLTAAAAACAQLPPPKPQAAPTGAGTIAQIYYWRAKPGKYEEYTRYVTEIAEPIDREAQRNGAFISVTTFVTRDTASAWTHMRVFVLRDSLQLGELSAKLDAAGLKLEPDSAKRRIRSEYSATLRESAGRATVAILP